MTQSAESRTRVLVIEDERLDRILIQELLADQPESFSLVHAESLSFACDRLSKGDIDVVLLDLGLPVSMGIATFNRLHELFPDVPVVVISGLNDDQTALAAVNKGAQDYLTKGELGSTLLKRTIRHAIERNRLRIELRNASLEDPLTGLYNRRGLDLLAGQQLKAASRTPQNLNLVFVDMDNLKRINDTLGHHVGDQALTELAGALRKACRASDIVARLGGDEFAVLLYCEGDYCGRKICDRLQEELDASNREGAHPYRLEFSVGIVTYNPSSPCTLDDLLAEADRLMYEDKKRKKSAGNE